MEEFNYFIDILEFEAFTMIKFNVQSKVYTVWDSIRLIYVVLKLTGYVTFTIDGKIENGKIKSTVFDSIVSISLNLFLCFVIFINVTNDFSLISTKSFLIDKGSHVVTIFLTLNVLVTSILNIKRRREIWGIFVKMHEFDKEASRK